MPAPHPRADRRERRPAGLAEDGFTLERTPEFEGLLTAAVADLVRRQRDLGITIPGDGEYGKAMSSAVDYGAWWSYSLPAARRARADRSNPIFAEPVRSEPGDIRLTSLPRPARLDPLSRGVQRPGERHLDRQDRHGVPLRDRAVSYIGQEAIATDIANLKAGLEASGLDQGFITRCPPVSGSRIANAYYATEEEYIWAWADVLREEYRAIVDAGLILQIDDPSIAENWDQINPEPSVEDYQPSRDPRRGAQPRARGLPEEQIRFHLCWGSWHGPHTTDIELRHIVDLMLEINAGAYSFEAANARHDTNGRSGRTSSCPRASVLVPGVVGHATNVVEHPELVADRIERFAALVGPENVDRLHRLRPRRTDPPADRLGQARGPGPRGGDRLQPALRPLGHPLSRGARGPSEGGWSPAAGSAAGDRHVATPLDLLYLDQIRGRHG